MTTRLRVMALRVALAVAVIGIVDSVPADTGQPQPCTPTTFRVKGSPIVHVVPANEDVKYGQCLFNSKIAFNQANPQNTFASCSGCHPNGRTDRGTHPVMITNHLGTFVGNRQVPNLLNVQFNVPLGWDGRHGGVLGDPALIAAAIQSAAKGAINSPVEMAGHIDPTHPADQAKLDALTAFLISRSPTAPNPNEPPHPPKPPATPEEAAERAATLARIKTGADVFFGRAASTQPLLAAGNACASCHVPPFFTDNKIRTNILHPDAAYDFGFPHAGGSTGPLDVGAGLTTVKDPLTGRSVQVGTFKTPSLHRFYPDGQPSLHSGIFAEDDKLFQFYEKSLRFKLAPGEATGLHYWLVNCPQGPQRHPASIPAECN
jgi:cytochrome c peroxidase